MSHNEMTVCVIVCLYSQRNVLGLQRLWGGVSFGFPWIASTSNGYYCYDAFR